MKNMGSLVGEFILDLDLDDYYLFDCCSVGEDDHGNLVSQLTAEFCDWLWAWNYPPIP